MVKKNIVLLKLINNNIYLNIIGIRFRWCQISQKVYVRIFTKSTSSQKNANIRWSIESENRNEKVFIAADNVLHRYTRAKLTLLVVLLLVD